MVKSRIRRGLWLGALFGVLFLPIVFYLMGLGRLHSNLWAMLLSLTGTQALGLFAFVITLGTRFRLNTSEFGVPLHKWGSLLLLCVVLIHVMLALLTNPDNIWLLTLWFATAKGAAGVASLLCIMAAISLGVYRRLFGLQNAWWRRIHVFVAWIGALLAFCHVLWIDQLVNDPLWRVLFACILVIVTGMWVSKYINRG